MEMNYDQIIEEINKLEYHAYLDEIDNNKVILIDFELASRVEAGKLILSLYSEPTVSTLAQENLNCNMLNIIYFFPEVFKTSAIYEARYLANRINCVALLPGFFVDDLNKKVFYRYTLPWVEIYPHDQRLKSAIKAIMNVIDIYTDLFIQISLGKNAPDLMEAALNDSVMYIKYLAQEQNKENKAA